MTKCVILNAYLMLYSMAYSILKFEKIMEEKKI